jgi:hypothetical protein
MTRNEMGVCLFTALRGFQFKTATKRKFPRLRLTALAMAFRAGLLDGYTPYQTFAYKMAQPVRSIYRKKHHTSFSLCVVIS